MGPLVEVIRRSRVPDGYGAVVAVGVATLAAARAWRVVPGGCCRPTRVDLLVLPSTSGYVSSLGGARLPPRPSTLALDLVVAAAVVYVGLLLVAVLVDGPRLPSGPAALSPTWPRLCAVAALAGQEAVFPPEELTAAGKHIGYGSRAPFVHVYDASLGAVLATGRLDPGAASWALAFLPALLGTYVVVALVAAGARRIADGQVVGDVGRRLQERAGTTGGDPPEE